jgi:hypothetical protein
MTKDTVELQIQEMEAEMAKVAVAAQVALLHQARLSLKKARVDIKAALGDTDVGHQYLSDLADMIEELDHDCADLCYNGGI